MHTYMKFALMATLALLMTGCATLGSGIPSKRYTGIIAVQESAEVWRIYDETVAKGVDTEGGWTTFKQRLEQALKDGSVDPVPFGDFAFIPYDGGQPYYEPHVVEMKPEYQGTYYFAGPSEFFMPGKAMCVTVPQEWGTIAHARRFPSSANSRTNCYDFGPGASDPSFARDRYHAATIVAVRPQDYGRVEAIAVATPQESRTERIVRSGDEVSQRLHFGNGFIDDDVFVWSRGGGAPLQDAWRRDGFRRALALDRLNLDAATQRAIRDRILNTTPEYIDLRRYEGEVLNGAMLSANGEIVTRPKIATDQWFNTKFGAQSWYVTVTRSDGTTERWQVIVPDVCGNLILIPRSGALPCICDPETDFCVDEV